MRTGAKVGVSGRSDLAGREAAKGERRPAGGSMPGEGATGAAGPLPAAVRPAAGEDMPRADMAVCGGIPQARQKWRQIGGRKVRAMAKLDESKAAWIVRRKAEGRMANRQIAEAMGVKVRRVQVLWPGAATFPRPRSSSRCPWAGRPAAWRGVGSTARSPACTRGAGRWGGPYGGVH